MIRDEFISSIDVQKWYDLGGNQYTVSCSDDSHSLLFGHRYSCHNFDLQKTQAFRDYETYYMTNLYMLFRNLYRTHHYVNLFLKIRHPTTPPTPFHPAARKT
jgi:hypothetical protein